MNEQTKLETWALVELMGHSRIVGKLSEHVLGANVFLRVDVPGHGDQPAMTKFFSPSAIYAITPIDEKLAMEQITQWDPKPVAILQSPLLAEKVVSDDYDDEGSDDDYRSKDHDDDAV
jgi:hypothetical protein